MKLKRSKSHGELHANALNDILFILLFFFLIVSTLANPNIVKVNNPAGKKDTKAKQNIVISIDKAQKLYLGQKLIDINMIDTILKAEVMKQRAFVDTPSVVVNADTSAYYGEVFKVMQSAKRAGAKVVAIVK
ncbi:biopolymer transporter ExbD [Panacibacter ginsenosidivorans]|uniref:Biopolymer transporter ExbD n=1 Tax=Panacibacter ginsenosidivorans TaxID=1813871 RepID=A0A5B8V7X2_9BACT|nr:biopolymer transporter ExbD [Panacibacter ginsenosidivorans]QEC67504.1 biopolymer transporter ExbD [Panacibacter ginsenosidivorans]